MNKLLFVLAASVVSATGLAQQPGPGIVAPAGGTASLKTMSIAWTAGEPAVATIQTTGRLYTQGFHQPLLRVEALTVADTDAPFQLAVAPNPVVYTLTVATPRPVDAPLSIALTDLNGRPCAQTTMAAGRTSVVVDMVGLPTGIYVLQVGQPEKRLLKTYRIIKQ